ncbi:MAG: PIG-L family deacetylase [Streptosporangiaceae bacterium]|jgi:LmbE family N-acetylglucosaminyl deacetylase
MVNEPDVAGRESLNRIDRPGTAEDTWASWPQLGYLPVARPLAWQSVVVVAAHPDDEVLGVGGTMAMLAAAGARLRLIAVTDGEGSHPAADPADIARTRAAESATALDLLGARHVDVVRLRLPDTGLAEREDELADLLREQCGGFEVVLAPWEGDAHADHEAAGRAARRAGTNVLTYPIWMWHWAQPGDQRVPWRRASRVVLPGDVAARKQAAIQAFTSQLTDREGGVGPVVPPGDVAHFTRGAEVLFG